MLDPLSCLSLASNIISVVDFTGKIIHGIIQVHGAADGSTITNHEIEVAARDLEDLVQGLSLKYSDARCHHGVQTEAERAMRPLTEQCLELSRELLEALSNIKSKKTRKAWSDIRAAFSSVWNDRKIRAYRNRFDSLQSALTTRLVSMIWQERSNLSQSVDNLVAGLNRLGLRDSNDLRDLHTEISKVAGSVQATNSASLKQVEILRTAVTSFIQKCENMRMYSHILKSLSFQERDQREMAIEDAHARTFEWALKSTPTGRRDNNKVGFYEWLESGDGVFWINGKAGSGKSTLMKYLALTPSTTTILKRWSGVASLCITRHFFWHAGSSIQKSQQGLWQGLLSQILSNQPQIIPEVCSSRWQAHRLGLIEAMQDPWSREELRQALVAISSHHFDDFRLCIFIDGLDEYEGDHWEIVQMISALTSSKRVKICASSRPWNVFIEAFSSKPSLVLEDLTQGDIRIYVNDRLGLHPRFQELHAIEATRQQFLQEIVDKSHGVFLWVYLVTRSLRRGLDNCDSLTEIEQRLREIPDDLYQFFQLMLNSIEKVYHAQTARLFQLQLEGAPDHSVMTLSFFADDDVRADVDLLGRAWKREALYKRESDAATRIRARCTDLLEIKPRQRFGSNAIRRWDVWFLHRTVVDFLRERDVAQLLSARSPSSLPPADFFCISYLKQLAMFSPPIYYHGCGERQQPSTDFAMIFKSLLGYLGRVQEARLDLVIMVMNALRAYLINHGVSIKWYDSRSWVPTAPSTVARTCLALLTALDWHLDKYVIHSIRISNRTAPEQDMAHVALTWFVHPRGRLWMPREQEPPLALEPDMLRFLLSNGGRANGTIAPLKSGTDFNSTQISSTGPTVWSLFLWAMFTNSRSKDKSQMCLELIRIFLQHCADQQTRISNPHSSLKLNARQEWLSWMDIARMTLPGNNPISSEADLASLLPGHDG